MEVDVTFLTRRGSAVMRRSQRIDARRVRFGRGTGNEVQLPDIRVDLTAAAMFPRGGVLTIQALGPSPLLMKGRSTGSVPVAVGPGDEVVIGPYLIRLVDPAPGLDAALTIELVQPVGDSLTRLLALAGAGLHGDLITKRTASWVGFLVVGIVCLIAPMMVLLFGLPAGKSTASTTASSTSGSPAAAVAALWEPGVLTNSHRFFATNCTACHRSPLTAVSDDACLACHHDNGSHTDRVIAAGGTQKAIGLARCTSCHVEHRGKNAIVVSDSRLCLQCHTSLAERLPDADARDVSGFAAHPQFRATVVADANGPRLERVELGSPALTDHPGIKFSHAAHLVPGGFPALAYKPLVCADCHTKEPGGQGFLPITYAKQCQRCHELNFERQDLPWPHGKVPHGDDLGLVAAVWNFYAGKLLQGGVAEAPVPAPAPAVLRRVPGSPGTAAPSADGATDAAPAAWVAAKTQAALQTIILDKRQGCAYCHYGRGSEGTFDLSGALPVGTTQPRPAPARIVAPVVLLNRFLPHAQFNHAQHAAVDCDQCHLARKAETSGTVLIPGIATCRACHGAEKAAQRAESSCIACHQFHDRGRGPMRAAETARP